jgi:outer membrane protein TolC
MAIYGWIIGCGLAIALIQTCDYIHCKFSDLIGKYLITFSVPPQRIFCLFAVGFTGPCIGQTLSEQIFPGLADDTAQAVQNSESTIEALFQQDRAEANALIRASRTHPSLDGFVQYHGQWEQLDPSNSTEFSQRFLYGLTLRKPLFHWGALDANRRIGEILLHSARENLAAKQSLVRNEFKRRILVLYISRQESAFAEYTLEHRKRMLEVGEDNYGQGIASLQELESARMNYRQSFQDSLRIRNHFRNIRHQFLRDFSVTDDILVKLPQKLPSLPMDLDSWRERLKAFQQSGFRNHPEYRSALDSIDVQENQILVDRARNRPVMDLVVGANQDDTTYMMAELDDRFRQIYFGGVRVTWNIFDGYETQGRINLAQTLRDQAVERKKRLARKLAQDALQFLHALENCKARIEAGKETLEWKEGRLRKAEKSFEAGQLPEIELDHYRFDSKFHLHQSILENARCLSLLLQADLLITLGQPAQANLRP